MALRTSFTSIAQRLVRELATGQFIALGECAARRRARRRQDALAIALGRTVVEASRSVPFISATALLAALAKAETDGRLAGRLLFYRKPSLHHRLMVRIDEPGSMLITTNQLVTPRGTVFGHEVLVAAILDRLLHHSHTRMIQGEGYRLNQKKKAELLGSSAER